MNGRISRGPVAEAGRMEDRRTGSRRLLERRPGGSDRKPAALWLCGFARDDQENRRTGGRWLRGLAGDERSIDRRLRGRQSEGPEDRRPVPGGLAIPETASETFGDSGGSSGGGGGEAPGRRVNVSVSGSVSVERQRDRGIVSL